MNGRKFTAVPILVGNTKTKTDQEYGKYVHPQSVRMYSEKQLHLKARLMEVLVCGVGSWRHTWRTKRISL